MPTVIGRYHGAAAVDAALKAFSGHQNCCLGVPPALAASTQRARTPLEKAEWDRCYGRRYFGRFNIVGYCADREEVAVGDGITDDYALELMQDPRLRVDG